MPNASEWWMTALSGNALAHIANMAGADRFVWTRPGATIPPSFYGITPELTGSIDVRPADDISQGSDHAPAPADPRRDVVLSEALFRCVMSRERRRADRFDEVFAVATIAVDEHSSARVRSALNVATRVTDVVGWIEQGRILGVILVDLPRAIEGVAHLMEARLKRELAEQAGADDCLKVRWYLHAGPGAQGAPGLSDADPLLDDLRSAEQRRSNLDACKRALDLLGCLALLLLLSPVFLLVAVLIKLTSPGPILFRQARVGQLAKTFTMLKFRTMHVNNDSALHQHFVTQFITLSDREKQAGAENFFKIRNDPRITPIGHFLRRTSLDELPQLWNVIRGDMSLVGPRPPLRYELEQYRPWHWRRVLEGKPGVTGLWQVEGRSRTTFDEMVRLDLHYVRRRNLWTDVRILLATPRAVVTGKGAC